MIIETDHVIDRTRAWRGILANPMERNWPEPPLQIGDRQLPDRGFSGRVDGGHGMISTYFAREPNPIGSS